MYICVHVRHHCEHTFARQRRRCPKALIAPLKACATSKHPLPTTPPPAGKEGVDTLVSQNVFINQFQKVSFPTTSSTYCLLLLIAISS